MDKKNVQKFSEQSDSMSERVIVRQVNSRFEGTTCFDVQRQAQEIKSIQTNVQEKTNTNIMSSNLRIPAKKSRTSRVSITQEQRIAQQEAKQIAQIKALMEKSKQRAIREAQRQIKREIRKQIKLHANACKGLNYAIKKIEREEKIRIKQQHVKIAKLIKEQKPRSTPRKVRATKQAITTIIAEEVESPLDQTVIIDESGNIAEYMTIHVSELDKCVNTLPVFEQIVMKYESKTFFEQSEQSTESSNDSDHDHDQNNDDSKKDDNNDDKKDDSDDSKNEDDPFYMFDKFESDLGHIVNGLCDIVEHDNGMIVVFGNSYIKKQRQKLQKKLHKIKDYIQEFNNYSQKNKLDIKANKVGSEIVVQKSFALPKFTGKREDFSNKVFAQREEMLEQRFELLKKKMDQIQPQLNKLSKSGFNHHFSVTINNQIYNFTDLSPKRIARSLVAEEIFYQGFGDKNGKLNITLSTGNIGQTTKTVLKDYLYISPNTKTRCIADCIAVLKYIKEDRHEINIFAWIKEQSNKIASRQNLIGGGNMEDVINLSEKYDFPIYKIGDKIERAGVIVHQQHCICVLPKDDKNQMIAQELQKQYYKQNEELITKKMIKDEDKQHNIYLAYDFEWTYQWGIKQNHEEDIKEDDEDRHVDQIPYAVSYWIFEGSNEAQKPQKKFGLDCCAWLVSEIKQIADKYNNSNIICYAHNGGKADYPFISKLLPKYFRKDNADFASQMATLSYNWNINRIQQVENKKGKVVNKQFCQRIQFQDSMNLMRMSLDECGNTFGCQSQKLECDHNAITVDNWESEIKRQNLEQYIENDVVVLGQALTNYSNLIQDKYGFPILGHMNVLSNSSLATNAFFINYYDIIETPIYRIPDDFFDSCKLAYHGGSCSVFVRGHLQNKKIFAIDINSSYPGQMLRNNFPVGPYYQMDLANVRYEGQKLIQGVYQVFIKNSPITQYPVFFTVGKDGVSQPAIVRNKSIWTTSPEIEYAYQCGYRDMYLQQCIVSRNSCNPFYKFIKEHYDQRCYHKSLRDRIKASNPNYKEDNDWIQHNMKQEQLKNAMNSLYGKFALSITRLISGEITSNSDLILNMLKDGVLSEYKVLEGDNFQSDFYQIGGVMQQTGGRTNIMIAAFITAYGRIQLNQMQRDCDKCGFIPIYSDTDSVYFMVDEKKLKTNREINAAMKQLGDIHCHDTDIGKCKFETDDDVGNCLKQYNELHLIQHPDDEPLLYPFADEAVVLALKSYALRSNITGRFLLKGKGIPEWMIYNTKQKSKEDIQRNLNRCIWNENARQFVFEDFISCANEGRSFEFKTIQFMIRKSNLQDNDKQHMKSGLKMTKTVACDYKQKIVAKSGICYPMIMNDGESITLPTAYEQQFNNEEYLTFNLFEEIKAYFDIKDNIEWEQFKAKNIVIRNGDKQNFIVFANRQAFINFFNNVITKQQIRNYHMMNSKVCQQLCFDIDCTDIQYIQDAEIDMSPETVEQELRSLFTVPKDVECEIVDRRREDKISYHIRFNMNVSYNHVRVLLEEPKCQVNCKQFIDRNVYHGSLRITQQSEHFLFNPLLFLHNFTLDKKQINALTKYEKENSMNSKEVQLKEMKTDSDRVQVQDYLVKNGLDKYFTYRNTKQGLKKGAKTINLNKIKGIPYQCQDCNRSHTNDNCIFLEFAHNGRSKKLEVKIKCYKHLQQQKAEKKQKVEAEDENKE